MKKIISIILLLSSFSVFTSFKFYNGIGNVYWDSTKTIFNGVEYKEQIAIKQGVGQERAKFISADLSKGNLEAIVYNSNGNRVMTLSRMIDDLEKQGYKVLGAINGDIFDMKTGTPKGLVIHNGIIMSSGYKPEKVITFDYSGHVEMKYPNLEYTLKGKLAYNLEQEQKDKPENNSSNDNNDNNYNNNYNNDENSDVNTNTEKVETEFTTKIPFINVPHGAAKEVHLFNKSYGNSTKTKGSCIEVIVDCGSPENTELKVGKTIKGTVKDIKVDNSNTQIGQNEVILSSVTGTAKASQLFSMVKGSEVEISVNDNSNQNFENVKEAIGIYYSILEKGNVVTYGSNRNPRTAMGIKEDNSIVLYTLDGRQNNSKGLTLPELANHMKDIGCVDAFNLDGGGSTSLYARLPGKEDIATLKNKPSGGKERKVSNAIILAYKGTGNNKIENINLYPELALVLPKTKVKIEAFGSNDKYEKIILNEKVKYKIEQGEGSIEDDGTYTSGDKEEKVIITGELDNHKGNTEIQVLTNNIDIVPSVKNIQIDINQTVDINMKVSHGPIKVISDDKCFKWSCDEGIGTIDENGFFKATSENNKNGNIHIEFENYKIDIPVKVGKEIIDFLDTKEHWARVYIGTLAGRKIIEGMGNNLYNPDGKLTRAQFLALLSKTIEMENTSENNPSKFIDVPKNEWYYKYVNWGFSNGIVNGITDTEFKPNESITREQMCIMLCKFSVNQAIALPQKNNNVIFNDDSNINYWAKDYVYTTAFAGIINGTPEKDFRPQGLATRAEAAKITYEFIKLKEGINEK